MSFQSYFDAEMRALQQFNSELSESNPDIDRLLEGVAYLTAQLHQRLDQDSPEISAQLLQQHWPHCLEPYASRTMLAFASQSKLSLPKGTQVLSSPVGDEKISCKFELLNSLVIYPLELIKVEINYSDIKFFFESKQANLKIENIRLYINTEMNTALEIYYAIGQAYKEEGESSIQLWLDYFGCREKFLFIDLDLNRIRHTERFFDVAIKLKHALPAELEIKKEMFRLNCGLAVNHFSHQAEPILYEAHRWDYALIPDKNYPKGIVLQHIKSMAVAYQWDYARHRLIIQNDELVDKAILSCEIMASNGHYPSLYIRENMINTIANYNNDLLKVKNMTRPTPYLLPIAHKNYLESFINLAHFNIKKLDLKKLLSLFNWSCKKQYQKQIDCILNLVITAIHKIKSGGFCQGLEFNLEIKEEGFKHTAEIYLLGCVLHAFFKCSSGVNYFIRTRIQLSPSSRILLWE